MSPSVAHDSVHLCLPTHQLSDFDAKSYQKLHSTPDRMTHIREMPYSEDVEDCARLPEVVPAVGSDIPPDSPIRSMFVIGYSLISHTSNTHLLLHLCLQLFTIYTAVTL